MPGTVSKHFVTFFSPGTFMAEDSGYEIDSWDVDKAIEMSHNVLQRYNARPYGFRFTTKSRGPDDLDSKVTDSSPFYYLGGEIRTLEEIKSRNDPKDEILISNMECNKWDRVITNRNSWEWTQPLEPDDVVLEYEISVPVEAEA